MVVLFHNVGEGEKFFIGDIVVNSELIVGIFVEIFVAPSSERAGRRFIFGIFLIKDFVKGRKVNIGNRLNFACNWRGGCKGGDGGHHFTVNWRYDIKAASWWKFFEEWLKGF